jgi:Sulfotransferase family
MARKAANSLRLPDFIGVGPSRTGTTWLHTVLRGHVGLPSFKETMFFEDYYDRGVEWYAKYFRHARLDQPMGEICCYFENAEARERIARHIPRCKIICTFRDPVERTYSSYKWLRRHAIVGRVDFEAWLAATGPILDANRYAYYLRAWQSRFGKDRVLAAFYYDLLADRQAFLDRICDFIAIPRIPLASVRIPERARNSFARAPRHRHLARRAGRLRAALKESRMYLTVKLLQRAGFWDFCYGRGKEFSPPGPEVKARLRESMRPEVEELERITGRDLSAWKYGRGKAAHLPVKGATVAV